MSSKLLLTAAELLENHPWHTGENNPANNKSVLETIAGLRALASAIESKAQVDELRKELSACQSDYEYIANLDVKHIPGICEWLIKRAKTCRAALSASQGVAP